MPAWRGTGPASRWARDPGRPDEATIAGMAAAWGKGEFAPTGDEARQVGDVVFAPGRDGRSRLHAIGADGPVDVSSAFEGPTRKPRGRTPSGLGPIELLVGHGGGTMAFTPNDVVMAFAARPAEMASLAPVPGLASMISGLPAVSYATSEVTLALTIGELAGLVGTELDPDEVVRLAALKGCFHEIRDDFYDWIGFEAFQPKDLRAGHGAFSREGTR